MEGEEEEVVDDLQVDSDEDFTNLMEEPVENLFNSPDVAEHLDELLGKEDQGGFVTIPQLNYSIPWRTVEDVADNELTKFTAESSGDLFAQDAQVSIFSFSYSHENSDRQRVWSVQSRETLFHFISFLLGTSSLLKYLEKLF